MRVASGREGSNWTNASTRAGRYRRAPASKVVVETARSSCCECTVSVAEGDAFFASGLGLCPPVPPPIGGADADGHLAQSPKSDADGHRTHTRRIGEHERWTKPSPLRQVFTARLGSRASLRAHARAKLAGAVMLGFPR